MIELDAYNSSVTIEIINNSTHQLASTLPHPVHLSYHWLDSQGENVVVFEGLRTPIHPSLPPKSRSVYEALLKPPTHPGHYILRLTLVQEEIRWFDNESPPLMADIPITVEKAAHWWDPCDKESYILGRHEILNRSQYKTKLSFEGQYRPLMLLAETTNFCPNQCIICPRKMYRLPKMTMSLESFQCLLENYSAMGGGDLNLTPFGEIFFDEFLEKRIAMILDYPRIGKVSFTTNGLFPQGMRESQMSFILKHLYRIHISVYGLNREEYRHLTRRDHYKLLLKNLKQMFEICDDKSKISLGFNLLKAHEKNDIEQWIRENIGYEVAWGSTRFYNNWGNLIDTRNPLPYDAQWVPISSHNTNCLLPLIGSRVLVNGKVAFCPCVDVNNIDEFNLGDCFKQSLLEMENSQKVYSLWWQLPNYCRLCTGYVPMNNILDRPYIFSDPSRIFGG